MQENSKEKRKKERKEVHVVKGGRRKIAGNLQESMIMIMRVTFMAYLNQFLILSMSICVAGAIAYLYIYIYIKEDSLLINKCDYLINNYFIISGDVDS